MLKKLGMIVGALFLMSAFAEDDYNKAIRPYKSTPSSTSAEVSWLEPHDKTYLPYNVCSEVKGFDVAKLDQRVDYYYDHKDGFSDTRHYYALVSIVRITYRVTCLNKLQYEGSYYLFSEPNKIDGSIAQSDDVVKRFKAHAHDWQNKPLDYLSEEGVFRDQETDYRFYGYTHFPKSSLKTSWIKQRVSYPEWIYTGVPGKKLAHPVLFVHGLDSDYEVWGVDAIVDKDGGKNKGNEDFQKGLVKKYDNGSAPDILARTMNIDNTEDNINHNGIYFFQAPGSLVNGEWLEAKPQWNLTSSQTSQSRKLYDQLVEIMNDFYTSQGYDWTKIDDTPIDIVAHSQGGLVVREMLRGLKVDAGSFPTGTANAANHIGKVITVDTPHFGSELAVANTNDLSKDYSGLKLIEDDLDAQAAGTPNEHTLVNATLDMAWYRYASAYAGEAADLFKPDGPSAILNIFNPVTAVLGYIYGAATSAFTDIKLTVKGPYFGKYLVKMKIDGPKDFSLPDIEIDALEEDSKKAQKVRRGAKQLDNGSDFMKTLSHAFNGTAYPLKPDGAKITLRPLYSPSTKMFLAEMIHSAAEEANRLCADGDESEGCFAVGLYFEEMAMKMAAKSGYSVSVDDVKINSELWNALVNIQDTWFDQSDALVTEYSQKFINKEMGIDPDKIKEFKEPRSYVFHDALAPWEDVLHGPNKINDGATKQGLDIACALDFYCDEVLGKSEAKAIYLNKGSVSLTGDFDMAPMHLEQGTQEVQISDGRNYLMAQYKPGIGSLVYYTDESGKVQNETILDEKIATSPAISRTGKVIHALFNNFSGKTYSKDYVLNNLSETATYSIIAENGSTLPKVLAGVANVTDPSTQTPPEIPPSKFYSKSTIFAYHREARGSYETNTSRPRILVGNTSEKDIKGFKVAYYFTADPARVPQVEVDYPKIPVTVENLGGDQWRFVLDASDSVLKAKSILPNIDGWQIRIHYSDWTAYKHLNDWSANYNTGIPKLNRKIVIYDLKGKILWGQEPASFKSIDDDLIASPTATVSWVDTAPWETNAFKPQVTIRNTGSVALKNYHAKLWFRVPQGKSLYIPGDDWYTPVSVPLLKNVGENVWELDMYFNSYILYADESVVEGNVGMHLTDWSAFDKTVCGIALLDSENKVLYGKVPTVEECQAYDKPSLITSSGYAWSF